MSSIIFILTIGLLNALRGSGFWKADAVNGARYKAIEPFLGRATWILFMAIATAGFALFHGVITLVGASIFTPALFFALWASFTPGWGLYFNCAFPNMKYINEKEIKIIDWIVTVFYKKPVNIFEFQVWCFIAMCLRGLLFFPSFAVIAPISPTALWCSLGMIFMGVVYWARRFTPVEKSIRIAEFSNGCLLGALINASLTI